MKMEERICPKAEPKKGKKARDLEKVKVNVMEDGNHRIDYRDGTRILFTPQEVVFAFPKTIVPKALEDKEENMLAFSFNSAEFILFLQAFVIWRGKCICNSFDAEYLAAVCKDYDQYRAKAEKRITEARLEGRKEIIRKLTEFGKTITPEKDRMKFLNAVFDFNGK